MTNRKLSGRGTWSRDPQQQVDRDKRLKRLRSRSEARRHAIIAEEAYASEDLRAHPEQ